jgi:hypothetical protein
VIKIETLAEFVEAGYSLSCWCPTCKRHGPTLDLLKYIEQGKGHLRPAQLRVRHTSCRSLLELRVHPKPRHGK